MPFAALRFPSLSKTLTLSWAAVLRWWFPSARKIYPDSGTQFPSDAADAISNLHSIRE